MKELQIAQVASRYYEKGMTQQEIAYKFCLSKMTVSRMLQKARELGIVKVGIKRPFQLNEGLQRQIEREYGLKKAIVVKQTNSKKNDISKLVGRVWAFYMNLSLPDDYIFGIGAIEKGTLLSAKLVSAKKLREIRRLGAVGDVLGHCFDKNGNFIKTDLEERLVSIPIKTLKSVPERIAVVGGEYKVQAIQGALRSSLMTTLVIDDVTAKKLLTEF